MALSKSSRIIILLVIDTAFFLLELITGYAVHSLALVADSFHMLNDVLSLFVGLWAVKVANRDTHMETYTYGWQRAETLGALVNGVFLVALCVTIFLDAIQRFVEPQIVSNPKLVLIVGCLGLASNLLGLVLFHDHSHGGHSHGGGHDHSHGDEVSHAEEGHAHSNDPESARVADESGNVIDVLPQQRVAGWPSTQLPVGSPKAKRGRSASQYSAFEEPPTNPRAIRQSVVDASRINTIDSDEEAVADVENTHEHHASSSKSPLLNGKSSGYGAIQPEDIDHSQHNHNKPKEQGKGHGHSHGDLNMRGIFLHVMGDALGNVGVILTALIIWRSDWKYRYYCDPAVSLVITIIILFSAIPLCQAASRILLQAVPSGIKIEELEEDILTIPGIVSCHDLHVWQLSDTKLIASLHVKVNYEFEGKSSAQYMRLVQGIRHCLAAYGIHFVTVQPEFCVNPEHKHGGGGSDTAVESGSSSDRRPSRLDSKASSLHENACLLECSTDCIVGKNCCAATSGVSESRPKPAASHDHDLEHDHGHSH